MVAIKNVSMPNHCGECHLVSIDAYGARCVVYPKDQDAYDLCYQKRPDWCPLIEVEDVDETN